MISDWHRLFLWGRGVEGEVVQRDFSWHPFLGPGGMVLIIVVLVASAIWLYREKGSDLSSRRKVLLFVLRCGALMVLFPILAQLRIRLETREQASPVIAVAVDTSASMSLQDRYATPEQEAGLARSLGLSDSESVGQLVTEGRLSRLDHVRAMLGSELVGFATAVSAGSRAAWFQFAVGAGPLAAKGWDAPPGAVVDALGSTAAEGELTDMAGSVDEIIAALRGQPLSSVILFTDGVDNTGRSPVAAAASWRDREVRVYPVVMGAPDPGDIELLQVIADRLLFKDDAVSVLVRLRSRGYENRTVPVILRQGEKEITQTKITLRRNQPETTVRLNFTPEEVGEFTFHVQVPPQAEEIVEDNNRMSFAARVTDEGIKVLFIENLPRWQYRFLRNAMHRDRRVDLSVLLLSGERSPDPQPPELATFPSSKEEFFRYDLIVLGDVSPQAFTTEQLDWIRELVAEEGAGFLALAGPFHNPWNYTDSVLADLFPVEVEPTGEEQRRWPRRRREDRFRLELTPEGMSHPIMNLGEEWRSNAPTWDSLPLLYWYAGVQKARPGTTVLAVHPRDQSEDRLIPLLAFQYFGRGGCFYSGISETWRWRLKQGDRVFYRFWGQVVQYLGTPHLEGKGRRLEIRTDKDHYARGETAVVTARGKELSLSPDQVYFGVAEDELGEQTRFPLKKSGVAEDLLEGRLTLTRPGLFRIWLEGAELAATAIVEVKLPRTEFQNPAADPETMRDIARMTGGEAFLAQDFPRLLDALEVEPVTVVNRREVALWDRPLWLILLCAMLAGEWVLRRVWQLP
jgi:uncharacterized membrane protein